jgi:hypothetical protein
LHRGQVILKNGLESSFFLFFCFFWWFMGVN